MKKINLILKQFSYLSWYELPFAFILLILPCIVIPHTFSDPLIGYPWYPVTGGLDVFLWWKALLLCVMGALMISCLFCKIKSRSNQQIVKVKHWEFRILLLYITCCILSAVTSEYPALSLYGCPDLYESIWVLVSYGICCSFGMFLVEASSYKKMLLLFALGSLPVLLSGLSQILNFDIFQYLFHNLNVKFNFNGMVYATLYNPNYVGSYVALLFPVLVALYKIAATYRAKIGYLFLICLSVLNLFGSKSSGGVVAWIVSCAILALLFREALWRHKKTVCSLGIFFFCLLFLLWKPVVASYIEPVFEMFQSKQAVSFPLESIETNNDNIRITYRGQSFTAALAQSEEGNFSFLFLDENKKQISSSVNENNLIHLEDKRFPDVLFAATPVTLQTGETVIAMAMQADQKEWYFTNQSDDGSYYYITPSRVLDKIRASEANTFFHERYSMASGRGYLWAKTLPLLKQHPFLGSGPDTFVMVYPNSDYVDNANCGYQYSFVNRPHNLYLQIAVQTGIPSVLAFLFLYVIYLIRGIRLFINSKCYTSEEILGIGILAGTSGYMIAGLVNDSMVCTAPLYWCLLGIGISINEFNFLSKKRNRKNQSKVLN